MTVASSCRTGTHFENLETFGVSWHMEECALSVLWVTLAEGGGVGGSGRGSVTWGSKRYGNPFGLPRDKAWWCYDHGWSQCVSSLHRALHSIASEQSFQSLTAASHLEMQHLTPRRLDLS